MLKYFVLSLLLAATILVASFETSSDERKTLNNVNRIWGGHEVDVSKLPYLISMRRKGWLAHGHFTHRCGGSIIKNNVIVTAAHCVQKRLPHKITIVAGTNNREGGDGAIALVGKIIMHEDYNVVTSDNDIALLILKTPLPINNITIAAIPLATEAPKYGSKAIISGWGATATERYSDKIMRAEVDIISNDRCKKLYHTYTVTERMICAGIEGAGGIDACQGDSGGPLVVDNKLAGITSWGRGCGSPNYPGVYTNVASIRDWINIKIRENA